MDQWVSVGFILVCPRVPFFLRIQILCGVKCQRRKYNSAWGRLNLWAVFRERNYWRCSHNSNLLCGFLCTIYFWRVAAMISYCSEATTEIFISGLISMKVVATTEVWSWNLRSEIQVIRDSCSQGELVNLSSEFKFTEACFQFDVVREIKVMSSDFADFEENFGGAGVATAVKKRRFLLDVK